MECPRCLQQSIKTKVPIKTKKFVVDAGCSGYNGYLPRREEEIQVGINFPNAPKFEQLFCDVCKECGYVYNFCVKVDGKFKVKG